MALRFFNTYSRQLEEFRPRDPAAHNIDIYTCGPTVYSRAHIGNFRAYIFEDLLQRHLELRGYKVHRVMNITDVDDKTIRGAREAGVPLSKFTAQFKQAFFEDIEALRIKRADEFPAATEQRYIDKMIEMISMLIFRGLAYQAEDKSVYFRINKFPDYGKLAHFDLTQLQSTGRVKHDEYDKEHIGDFALWKAWDEEDGDVGWESPWGRGRPGWHIECSAMATALLGDQIDIHCGGVDNIFPHHEAEIAQSEGVTGHRVVTCWMHGGLLMLGGARMAKSAGNFFRISELEEQGFDPLAFRYLALQAKYRTSLNFSTESLAGADRVLRQLRRNVADWSGGSRATETDDVAINDYEARFQAALADDLDMPAAMALIAELTRSDVSPGGKASLLRSWDRVLGLDLDRAPSEAPLPAGASALLEAREHARAAKDFTTSDRLRDELATLGVAVTDTPDGQRWRTNPIKTSS